MWKFILHTSTMFVSNHFGYKNTQSIVTFITFEYIVKFIFLRLLLNLISLFDIWWCDIFFTFHCTMSICNHGYIAWTSYTYKTHVGTNYDMPILWRQKALFLSLKVCDYFPICSFTIYNCYRRIKKVEIIFTPLLIICL